MSAILPMGMSVFDTVFSVVEAELLALRGQGTPFKTGYAVVARKLSITARRARQYHERKVAEDAVTGNELYAALKLHNERRRARIAEAMALLAQEGRA